MTSLSLPHKAGRVAKHARTTYFVTLSEKGTAQVYARGDGDIDLIVRDTNGKIIASDTESDSSPVCVWQTDVGRYQIEVVSGEAYSVDYVLFSSGGFDTGKKKGEIRSTYRRNEKR